MARRATVRGCCSAPLLLWPPAGKPIQKSRVNGGLKKVDPPPNILGAQTYVKKCFNKTVVLLNGGGLADFSMNVIHATSQKVSVL